jgi:hypothetical protein
MSKDTTQLAITVGRYEMLVELHEKETKALLEIAERMEQAKAKAEIEADLCSECDGKILYRGHTYDCECECHEQPISVLSDGGFDLMTL